MVAELSKIPAHRRRLLLVGTEADRVGLELDRETRRLLVNPSLCFVDFDEATQLNDPILQALAAKGLFQVGDLLVQSLSAPNQYTRLSNISDRTAELKLDVTVRVCQLLGARRVEVRHAEFESKGYSATRKVDAKVTGVAQGNVKATSSTIEVGGLRLRSAWVFQGSAPHVDDADQALANSGLQDRALQSLVDFFRTTNWPTNHEFEISTTQEMRRIREIVSDLSIPATFKGHTELETFKAAETSYHFQLWVEFAPAR